MENLGNAMNNCGNPLKIDGKLMGNIRKTKDNRWKTYGKQMKSYRISQNNSRRIPQEKNIKKHRDKLRKPF